MITELMRAWKEKIVTQFEIFSWNFLGGFSENHKALPSEDPIIESRFESADSRVRNGLVGEECHPLGSYTVLPL
jgi:hypothetical protein